MEYMKHIMFENACEYEDEVYKIRQSLAVQMVNMADKLILKNIIAYAKEVGITDLYLLDKEFVRTALLHEVERRRENN